MKYTIEFYAINVNEQRFDFLGSTTSYKGLNFADRLNDHGGAMFSLNLLDPTCNTRLIKRFVNQVVIKRGNSVRFVGPIINYSGTYDDTGGYLDIECGSYLYHLNSRYTDDLVTYTGEEQSDICWDLIDTVQSRDNGYLGIEEGGLTATGVDRDRTYEYYPVSQALTNLADVINGMDFTFSAQLDGDNKLEKILFNTHYPLGSLRTNLPPLKIGENIKLKTFKSNSNLHNYATAIGAGLVDPITSIKENTALQKAYTRRESIINRTDISIQTTLDNVAETYINNESTDRLAVMIKLYPDRTPSLTNINLGDSLKLEVEKGDFLSINRDYRVEGIEVGVDINDAEEITLI
jgi:hypothetical protein